MNIRQDKIWSFLKGAGLMLIALLILCFWYLGAAFVSAAMPLGGRAQIPSGSEPVTFICEAPFHTDIALPLNDPLINWQTELADALPYRLPPDTYLLFGWGDSVFFTQVLEPDDMTASRALSALAGANQAALRIVPVDGWSVQEYCEAMPVDAAGRAALIEHIRESFKPGTDGELQLIETPVPGEVLVKARGRYSLFNTCNQWTAAALGRAGLPRAAFAPFSFGVTKPLKDIRTRTPDAES